MNRLQALYYAYWAKAQDGPIATIEENGRLIQYFNNGRALYLAMKNKPSGYKTGAGGHLYGNLYQMVFSND